MMDMAEVMDIRHCLGLLFMDFSMNLRQGNLGYLPLDILLHLIAALEAHWDIGIIPMFKRFSFSIK